MAADLLGVKKVRLYHDQALFKEPGGGRTPWHQDKFYWPLDTDKIVTMWMPLVEVDEEMGLMKFASGSHADGAVENVGISDESEEVFSRYIDEKGFHVEGPTRMDAGDATFHLGWTIHSAGPNLSTRMREVMTIIYYPDGARITAATSKFQKADLNAWFPGLQPGDIAASDLNPIMNWRDRLCTVCGGRLSSKGSRKPPPYNEAHRYTATLVKDSPTKQCADLLRMPDCRFRQLHLKYLSNAKDRRPHSHSSERHP